MMVFLLLTALTLALLAGLALLRAGTTGRRYTQDSLAAQLSKPPYREIKAAALAADGWVAAHAPQELFVVSYDGKRLHATFLPQENARGTILLFHGYRSCWQIDFGASLSYYYDTLGYQLLLVDQRAHGKSEGRFLTFGVRERYDVISWVTYLSQLLGEHHPMYLGGLSMGATTVLLASCFELPANVRGITADSGFTSPYEIAKSVLRRDHPRLPLWPLLAFYGLFTRLFAGYGLRETSTCDAVRESRYPILFIHGTADTFVPCEMTKRAFEACRSEKTLVLVDGAEHGKSYLVDKPRVQQALQSFFAAHLPR